MARFNRNRRGPITGAMAGDIKHRSYRPTCTIKLLDIISSNCAAVSDKFVAATEWREGCLYWIGSADANGYGLLYINRRRVLAHRAAWVLANQAEIPDGHHICHRCDNPSCVNPAHLWAGTGRQNMIDMYVKGRGASTIGRGGRVIAAEHLPEYVNHFHGGI
jgi:hypothetical protein